MLTALLKAKQQNSIKRQNKENMQLESKCICLCVSSFFSSLIYCLRRGNYCVHYENAMNMLWKKTVTKKKHEQKIDNNRNGKMDCEHCTHTHTHTVSLRYCRLDLVQKDIYICTQRANHVRRLKCRRMFLTTIVAFYIYRKKSSRINDKIRTEFTIWNLRHGFLTVYLYFLANNSRITTECDKNEREEWTKCVKCGADDELWFLSFGVISRVASIL